MHGVLALVIATGSAPCPNSASSVIGHSDRLGSGVPALVIATGSAPSPNSASSALGHSDRLGSGVPALVIATGSAPSPNSALCSASLWSLAAAQKELSFETHELPNTLWSMAKTRTQMPDVLEDLCTAAAQRS